MNQLPIFWSFAPPRSPHLVDLGPSIMQSADVCALSWSNQPSDRYFLHESCSSVDWLKVSLSWGAARCYNALVAHLWNLCQWRFSSQPCPHLPTSPNKRGIGKPSDTLSFRSPSQLCAQLVVWPICRFCQRIPYSRTCLEEEKRLGLWFCGSGNNTEAS